MADWYVYEHDGDPLGPWSTDAVANAILAGKLAPDVWVAAPGGPRWLRALDVPVIARLAEGIPTRPRRDSGLRLIPGARTSDGDGPSFGSTMMIVKDDEVSLSDSDASAISAAASTRRTPSADETAKYPARDFVISEDPPTDPAGAPSSMTPSSPDVVINTEVATEAHAPSTDRRRRRKNG
ncbi:MAG: hypothetical protein JWP87_13 [Labilithrix sp.]|nr:hypothetical protein [Labilithrix sp.]